MFGERPSSARLFEKLTSLLETAAVEGLGIYFVPYLLHLFIQGFSHRTGVRDCTAELGHCGGKSPLFTRKLSGIH